MRTRSKPPVSRRSRRQLPPSAGACSMRASASAAARSRRAALRTVEDEAIRDIVRFQEDLGLAGHHRRRVSAHLFPHRLPRAARRRRDQGRHLGELSQHGRQRRFRAAGDERHRSGSARQADPGGGLQVPAIEHPAHAQGHDSLADDAALSRRTRGDQPRGLSRHRGLLRRRRRRVSSGDRCTGRRRLPLPAARRHQPGLPVRRKDAGRRAPARRRPERVARVVTRG